MGLATYALFLGFLSEFSLAAKDCLPAGSGHLRVSPNGHWPAKE
jgi:hypothetical protein